MARYRSRRHYRRGGNNIAGAVGDVVSIASKLSAKGALITGAVAFVCFYFLLPLAIEAWFSAAGARMQSSNAEHYKRLLDTIASKRFIRPLEWAGMACLIGGVAIAAWKRFFLEEVDVSGERQVSRLSRLLARLLD